VGNAVTFLRLALRYAIRTLFRSQGTTHLFFVAEKKPERQGRKPENRLTTGYKDPSLTNLAIVLNYFIIISDALHTSVMLHLYL
jgi:hypothetical protein